MNTGYIFLRQGVNTPKIAHLLIVWSVLVFKIALLKSYLGRKQILATFLGMNSQLSTFFATKVLGVTIL